MYLRDRVIQAVKPRWYLYPVYGDGRRGNGDIAYDADAEFVDMEDAADQLAEAYIKHNNRRYKCTNLKKPEAMPCSACLAEYNDQYYVWKLSLRVQRFEVV